VPDVTRQTQAAAAVAAATMRPATNADGEAVRALVFGVLREYGLQPSPADTDADLFDIESSYFARGGRLDVLVDASGNVIGTVGLYPIDAATVELRKMYLHKQSRGAGHGRRMLEHAVAEARRMGFGRMTLETASVLKEAVALYTRHGFRPCMSDHMASRCDQVFELMLSSEEAH
jgi:GNAT superfamily N-acetyltransferase